MDKDLSRQFSKEETKTTKKKNTSKSVHLPQQRGKCKLKQLLGFISPHAEMPKISKMAGKIVKKEESLFTEGENENWQVTLEISMENSQKTKNKFRVWPSYTPLWHMPKGLQILDTEFYSMESCFANNHGGKHSIVLPSCYSYESQQ